MVKRRVWNLHRSWTLLWLGFSIPLSLSQLLVGNRSDALHIILIGLAGLLSAALLQMNRRNVVIGLFYALAIILLCTLTNVAIGTLTWSTAWMGSPLSPSAGIIEGTKTRRWYIPGGTDSPSLAFSVHGLTEGQGTSWQHSHPGITASYQSEENFTRITFPENLDPYVMRWFDIGEALGGRTFEVTLELRALQPIPAEGLRGLWLQVWDGKPESMLVLPTAIGTDWKSFSLTWIVPQDVTDSTIRLALNDFDGLSIDVRRVSLKEKRNGIWTELFPLAPNGLTTILKTDGAVQQRSVLPTKDTTTYLLSAKPDFTHWIEVTFVAEPGSQVYLSDFSLNLSTGIAWPVPVFKREHLWFVDPNLMGHSVVTLGLTLLLLTSSSVAIITGAVIMLVLVGLTASRTASFAAVFGISSALLLAHRSRAIRIALVIGIVGTVGLLGFLGPTVLGRLGSLTADVVTPRYLIWSTAWNAMLDNPVRGLGGSGFMAAFQKLQGTVSNEAVSHAHNIWLQFGASYGVPGLIAIAWLTGGLIWLGWSWARWRGLALILPVLVMNFFDFSLFYQGVLYPLVLGLNVLRSHRQLL